MGFSKQNLLAICSTTLILVTYVPLASPHGVVDDSGFLKAHNEARAEVGVPPLCWNETIAQYAQEYANKRSIDCAMDSGFLKAHNEARAEVGVPPLCWNETIAQYAQEYANKRSIDCAMEHSMGPYAENIASGLDMTGEAATKYWCTEIAEYDYNTNKCTGPEEDGCHHYTTIVARVTTQLGCARAKCKNGDMFVTCNYDPFADWDEKPY